MRIACRRGKNNRDRSLSRSIVGASLTELLIASLLIGFTTALIGELVVTTTIAAMKLSNKSTLLGSAKVSTERIVNDIQMARSVGDYYGLNNGVAETIAFPNPSNPLFGTTGSLVGSSGAPDSSQPVLLSAQCLILQQPVLFWDKQNYPGEPTFDPDAQQSRLNGFPIRIKANEFSDGVPSVALENLDTVVYQVVPDTSRTGEYVLQVSRFSGYHDPTIQTHYESPINPPVPIASGIIGPKPLNDPSALPQVFRYLTRTVNGTRELTSAELATDNNIKYIAGVAIDLEFKKSDVSSQSDINAPNIGVHNEAFLKSNRLHVTNFYDD